MAADGEEGKIKFTRLSSDFAAFKEHRQLVEKWGLASTSLVGKWRFDHKFKKNPDFLTAFFNDPDVQSLLRPFHTKQSSVQGDLGDVKRVDADELGVRETSMTMFDRVKENSNIIRANGAIAKMMDMDVLGLTISDKLREAIISEDAEDYGVFDDDERDEFLFRLFAALVKGGTMCQYEDMLQPYLDVCKALYKELVAVQKNTAGELEVISTVYDVRAVDADVPLYFDANSPCNFCFISIDPLNRHVSLWYNSYLPWW